MGVLGEFFGCSGDGGFMLAQECPVLGEFCTGLARECPVLGEFFRGLVGERVCWASFFAYTGTVAGYHR